jgi:hypothetical protein
MRTAAKRLLGGKPSVKLGSKSRGVKIKLKVKSKSVEGLAKAVKKISTGLNNG